MSFGLGIANFVDGIGAGMQMREGFDQRREKRQRKKTFQQIGDQTETAFQQAVADGTASPDEYDQFWMRYALPKLQMEMMRTGDIEGARRFYEWGLTDKAREGARLFMSGLAKAQMGDPGGALDDAIKAAQTQGYIDTDYKLKSQDELRSENGDLLGYRLTIDAGDGKEIVQDVQVGDVGKIVATLANPQAAWQLQEERRGAAAKKEEKKAEKAAKRKADLEDYKTKKEIDQLYKGNDFEKDYASMAKALENDIKYMQMSPNEKDAMIRDMLANQEQYAKDRGGTGTGIVKRSEDAPGITPADTRKKILVDTVTGKPVERAQGRTPNRQPQSPAPRPDMQPQPSPSGGGISTKEQESSATGRAQPALTPEARRQAIDEARNRMIKYGNVAIEYEGLRRMGITDEEINQHSR